MIEIVMHSEIARGFWNLLNILKYPASLSARAIRFHLYVLI